MSNFEQQHLTIDQSHSQNIVLQRKMFKISPIYPRLKAVMDEKDEFDAMIEDKDLNK